MIPDLPSKLTGESWAEEMNIRDPIENGEDASSTGIRDEVCLVDVGPWTEEHLKQGLMLMKNTDRRRLRNTFSLLKVPVTKTPSLDPVMVVQCSKNTKANEKTLARLQAITLNAVGPLTDLLEKLNSDAVEIDADKVGYTVESAITLIGNVSSQISIFRREKILEEYNMDLLSFAQDREGEFIKAAPMLFGAQFPKDAADHLEQVAALRRAK